MKRELSHDDAVAALEAVALDALDSGERELVLAHVAGCAECRVTLQALRAAAAQLAYAVAPGAESNSRDRVRSRLMARAGADASQGANRFASAASTHQPVSTLPLREIKASQPLALDFVQESRGGSTPLTNVLSWRRAEWVAMAASVLLVVSVGLLASAMKDRADVREAFKDQLGYARAAVTESDSLHAVLASRDSLIAGLTGKGVAVMSLTSSGANAPFARMFWDQQRNTWTLVAHNMPELKAGRTYQLWLVTGSKKISAGTFASQNGEAVVRATYALSPADLKALAVTEEPIGGMPQPTGAPIIAVTAH